MLLSCPVVIRDNTHTSSKLYLTLPFHPKYHRITTAEPVPSPNHTNLPHLTSPVPYRHSPNMLRILSLMHVCTEAASPVHNSSAHIRECKRQGTTPHRIQAPDREAGTVLYVCASQCMPNRPDAAIHPPQPLPCINDPDPDNLPPGTRFRTTSRLGIHVCKGFHAGRISALFTLLDAVHIRPIAIAVTVRYISCPLQRHPIGPTNPLPTSHLQRNNMRLNPGVGTLLHLVLQYCSADAESRRG
jgi:hypothetical protein